MIITVLVRGFNCLLKNLVHNDYHSIGEGEFRFNCLLKYLVDNGFPKVVSIGEDATGYPGYFLDPGYLFLCPGYFCVCNVISFKTPCNLK